MKNLLRRLIFYIITMWAAVTFTFFLVRLMPGDPAQSMINRYQGQISADAINSIRVMFGLDKTTSTWTQYWQYWGQLLHGDMGISFKNFPTPVADVIAQSLPWTIGLVGVVTIISFVLGSLIGVTLGWHRGSVADAVIPITTFFSSIPYFWIALVLSFTLGVSHQIFPFYGGFSKNLIPGWSWSFVVSVLYHAILPALTIIIVSIAGWILGMRNMMITVSSEDYVTVAHAKGLSESTVMYGYAARNAILPQISGFSLSLGFVVSGSLVMEQVFSYPGIGYALFAAVGAKDYPLMQGIFLIITFSVLVANIVADVVYAILDPRTRRD